VSSAALTQTRSTDQKEEAASCRFANVQSSKRYEPNEVPNKWSPPALAAGAENFKQFEAEVSDEFKAAAPRIC